MRAKKANDEPGSTILARVKREMAKPRMSKSATIAARKLDSKNIPEQFDDEPLPE
jgi:hypothetical protein